MIDFENNTISLDLFKNVLKELKNTDSASDIIDSFSNNQFESKGKLLELIDNLNILDDQSEIIIFGCWYGSVLIPGLASKVKRITGIDLDDKAIKIAKNSFFKNYSNIDYITDDVFSKFRGRYSEAKLFINTSCEHMPPMKAWSWWPELKNDAYFAFQSNNMFGIQGHTNCVISIEEFKSQLPENFDTIFENELQDPRGTRYTLVGKITKR